MHEQNSGSSGDPKGSPLFWARQVPSWIRWRLRSGGPRTQPSGANPKVTGSNPVPATIESPVTSGAFLLGSNGLEVVLPTRCPQESVQIHSVRSLPYCFVYLWHGTGWFRRRARGTHSGLTPGEGCPLGNQRNRATVRERFDQRVPPSV